MQYSWILDSGGAGRGAWQGGVIYEFMRWCRKNECFPSITMGASAGGYAAADVATGTERTVMKGWTAWGTRSQLQHAATKAAEYGSRIRGFRKHLRASIFYVMEATEQDGVFKEPAGKKLLVFTTRVARKDGRHFEEMDRLRYFIKSAMRKLPEKWKYLPEGYIEEPVVFATNLPEELQSEYVRPLTRENYHAVLETTCLVPLAMGRPLDPGDLRTGGLAGDNRSVFIDGSYALKMPMRIFGEDPRFGSLARWAGSDKTIVFCCDPKGLLWEDTTRLRCLNRHPAVIRAIEQNRLLIVYPDHKVEAGFLCTHNPTIMRTFERGREQAVRLLESDTVRNFFER